MTRIWYWVRGRREGRSVPPWVPVGRHDVPEEDGVYGDVEAVLAALEDGTQAAAWDERQAARLRELEQLLG